MKLLITGFDPFGGETANASWDVVKELPESLGNVQITKLQIPTVFKEAAACVLRTAKQLQPQVILCIGQAGGRDAVTPERIGINLRDASICDNAGNCPREEKIDPQGPDGLFATVPVAEMVEAIRSAGLPARVSNTAGTFVCNDVLYTLLNHYRDTSVRVGFIHVPWGYGQGTPFLAMENTFKALCQAIRVLDKE